MTVPKTSFSKVQNSKKACHILDWREYYNALHWRWGAFSVFMARFPLIKNHLNRLKEA